MRRTSGGGSSDGFNSFVVAGYPHPLFIVIDRVQSRP